MKKATYNGTISQDVKNFDLANINAYDWFSQFPKDAATEKERAFVEKITEVIKSNDAEKNYTFSDDRFVLIATNLIRLVPKDKYNFTISEYLIFYRYIQVKYDTSIQGIDNLIEFVNQMIGFSAEGGTISDEQKEMLSQTAESIELQALRMCPVFIAEDIDSAIKEDVEEVDMAGVEVLEKPIEKDLDDEMEEEEDDEEIISILSSEDAEEIEIPIDEEEENRVEINQEEYDLLDFLVRSDFTSDGNGIMGNLEGDDSYSIKEQIRISKGLSEKGVLYISTSTINGKKVSEASVTDNYQEESEGAYGGYRLVNLIFNGKNIEDYFGEEKTIEQAEGEPSDIAEWRDTINTLQELIDENDSPESNEEWQDTIDTLKELITDSGYSFDYGGITNRNVSAFRIPTWATPALINGDLSGLSDEDIVKLDEFVDDVSKAYGNAYFMLGDNSNKTEFKASNDIDGNLGGDVTTLYVKPTLPRKMYNDGGGVDEIKSEIEKQERKLNLASLPDSAKDAIRKKIVELKGRLEKQEEKQEEKPKAEAKEEKGSMNDADIRAEIEKQEKKLGLASLPESAKDAIRKKIEQLKGQLSSKDEEPIKEAPKKKEKPQPKPKEKPVKKVIDKLEEIEEEDEESPIEKVLGKTKKAVEEIIEPKIPKKRGRKPKPKVEAEPKVPQKRGRKPKPKLSLTDFGLGTKFNINDFI